MNGPRISLREPYTLTVKGERRHLRFKVWQIIWALMSRPFCTPAELTEILWPNPDHGPQYEADNVGVAMSRARDALAGSGWRIACVRRFGYCLARDHEVVEDELARSLRACARRRDRLPIRKARYAA